MAEDRSKETVERIRLNTLATMAEVTAEKKPDYYVGGKRYDWAEYLIVLQRQVDWCDRKLREYDSEPGVYESGIILE